MNNKDFLNQLAGKINLSMAETKQMTEAFTNMFADYAEDGTVYSIQGFGNFEVKKKLERIVVNPSTKQRMMVPPKLVLSFKPSSAVKDKFKK
jgi:DNA-binding protein HU-beta